MNNKLRVRDGIIVFVLFIAALIGCSILQVQYGIYGLMLSEVIFAFIVILAAKIREVPVKEALSLKLPSIKHFFAGLFVFAGTYLIMVALANALSVIMPDISQIDRNIYPNFIEGTNKYAALIGIALLPGICEELVFRGFLLNSFKSEKHPFLPIIIVGFLFGAAHLDIYKFLPVSVLGIGLTYIAVKSKSVLLPMIFHFINNALSLISMYATNMTEEVREAYTPLISNSSYLGYAASILAIGTVLTYVGIRLFSEKRANHKRTAIILVVSGLLFISGLMTVIFGETKVLLFYNHTFTVNENNVTEEVEFTVDKDSYCSFMISTTGVGEEIYSEFKIVDSEGEVIMSSEGSNNAYSTQKVFDKGTYNLIFELSLPEDSTSKEIQAVVQASTVRSYGAVKTDPQ